MVKAILFDLWGTLVEQGTYSPLRQTYKILRVRMRFGSFVHKFEEVFMTKRHESQEAAFEEVFNAFRVRPKKFLIDKLIGLWNKNRLLAEPYPETLAALKELRKDFKLVLLSNAECFVETVLEKYNLTEYFDAMALSFEAGHLKQDPKLFEIALEKIGVNKEDAVMVGDSIESDITGAERAGIRAVLIDRKDRRDFNPKIKSLNELRGFLQK